MNFRHDGFLVILYEPYNKTEISLLKLNDPILTGSILTIRSRVVNLFIGQFEKDIGEFVNRKVRMLTPKYDIKNMLISHEFLYIYR